MSQNEYHQASSIVHVNKYFYTNWDEMYMAEKDIRRHSGVPHRQLKELFHHLLAQSKMQ